MTDEAMSPLRRRMIEDMTIRKLAPKTQHDYVQMVKNFAAFLGRSPDMASFEDVRRYQLHLAASGVGVPTINQTVSTLRFFFRGRSGATISSSTRNSFTSRARCRRCSARRKWRSCSMPHPGSRTRRR
jgi:site-specific recombinase XerD